MPGLPRYLAWRMTRRRSRLPSALSLRSLGDTNYFHIINDLLGGRIRLAEECGISFDVPIVISESLASMRFFQEFRDLTSLRDRFWLVQGSRDIVRSPAIYFANTERYCRKNFDYVRELLGVPDSDPETENRVFLIRQGTSRRIHNYDDIESICRTFGFRLIDTAGMSLAQQIEIFSNARYVVGVHGAGLTNIIFRKNAPLSLLEIFPGSPFFRQSPGGTPWLRAHYFYICRVYGFDYAGMIGGGVPAQTSRPEAVRIDPSGLSERIERMLSAGPTGRR
jgi:hypothetical protein